jgi:NadR type nicotinamide-nucleotide adenylyltransferase
MRETFRDLANVTVAGGIDPHPIDYHDPAVWDRHEQEFRATLATVTDRPVTAVFTSEAYGTELARRFGARHVAVDPDRALVPISSTAVRADPVGSWDHLPRPVRAGLCLRVVVLGAESTGTTTVSRLLTDALRARGGAHGLTRWVPEVGRAASITKLANARAEAALVGGPTPTMDDLAWPSAEFVAIAEAQNRLEDRLAREGGPVLVCDTDAFATGVWHERYVGQRSNAVENLARSHPLYLLTGHEGVPFQQDELRDGEHLRPWMTERFEQLLRESGRPFVRLDGSADERLHQAVRAVDELLATGWRIEGHRR